MPIKISRMTFKSLWNSEYTMLVNQIIAIITKYKPAVLHLVKSLERVTAFLPELARIKAQELSSALSHLLDDLDHERDVLINAIIGQVRVMGKLSLPSIAPHVLVMGRFFDLHGRDIADAPYNSETMRLDNLLDDYNAKTDVKAAAEALNMKILFDQLAAVNAKFASNFLLRAEADASIEKLDSREIRSKIDKALVEFFDSFEHCSREFDDLDYTSPANELNLLINYYKAQVKARATRRNSGKDVSTEPPIDTPE
jgi:signal transduction histidine kinase